MKKMMPVYITPDKGQTLYELACEIYYYIHSEQDGKKIFLILPDESVIEVKGETITEIRDSIGTQCAYGRFWIKRGNKKGIFTLEE